MSEGVTYGIHHVICGFVHVKCGNFGMGKMERQLVCILRILYWKYTYCNPISLIV